MAREHYNQYPDRDSYRGGNDSRSVRQDRDLSYETRDGSRDDRQWQRGPDDRNGPYGGYRSADDLMPRDNYQGRDRNEYSREYGRDDWEANDRSAHRQSYRNGWANQADGSDFRADMNPRQRNHGYQGSTSAYQGASGYPSYGGGRRHDGRDFMDGGQRRDFGSYGSEYLEDGFGSLRDPRREGQMFSGSDVRFSGMSSQDFRGRGPKGWQRSDERIQEDLSVQLEQHSALDASDIEVKVQDGEVTLTGTTNDRQMKRLAEDIAERVPGVKEVQNQIRLNKAEGQSSSSERRQSADHNESKQSRRAGQATS